MKVSLDENIYFQVQTLCEKGEVLVQDGKFEEAVTLYWNAYDVLPDPKHQWEAATWILAAIGDANFLTGDFVAGKDNLGVAMLCPGAVGNPFLHLRLGQCLYETGNFIRAADELGRAYMGAGEHIFESENPKYFDFLKTHLQPPVSKQSD